MAEQIKKSDIISGNPFDEIAKEISTALAELEKFDNISKILAKSMADLSKEQKKTIEGINKINQANSESQKLFNETLAKKELERKLLKEEAKIKIDKLKTDQQIAKEQERISKATEKQNKLIKDSASEYRKLVIQTRDLKNESKNLGAEMLKLEANGQKNTKAYKQLEKQYKETTNAARQGDAQLKKLDATVGDNFRNVGNYQKAIGGLKNVLGQLGLAFGGIQIGKSLFDTEVKLQSLRMALKNVTKDQKDYTDSLKFVNDMSLEYGQDLTVLTDTYKSFRASANASGLAVEEQNKIYSSIIKSGGALAMTNEQIEGSLLAVSQMFSKGKVSAEELRGQLGERLPGAFGIMAKAVGVSEAELGKMMEKGEVIAKDVLPLFAKELENTFGDKAKENLNTVGGAWNVLTTKISNYISEANDGGRATKGLAGAIRFIGDNLGTIITTIGYAVKAFLAYKATMIAMKGLNMAKSFYDTAKAIAQGSMSLKDATGNMGKFGSVLKGAGIGLAVTLFAELAMEIWDVASGAERARKNVEAMNKAMDKGSKYGSKRLQEIKDQFLIEKANAKTAEQAEKNFQLRIKTEIQYLNESKKIAQERLDKMKFVEQMLQKNPLLLSDTETRMIATYQAEKNAIYEANAELRVYYAELKDINRAKLEDTIASNEQEKATRKATKEIKDQSKELEILKFLFRDTKNELEGLLEVQRLNLDDMLQPMEEQYELERQIELMRAETLVIEREIALSKAKQKGDAKEIAQAEKDLLDAKEKQIKAQLKYDLENAKSKAEKDKLNKQAELDILNLGTSSQSKDAIKERVQVFENFQKSITDILTEQIDKRIALLEEEKQAAENQQNYLQDLAAQGNITAQQSIAEQIQIQREAQAEQARLERQKQNIELISQGLSTFNQQLADGKNPGEALAATITSTTALVGFLKNLNFFAKGTDYAPEGMAVVDEKGAEIITDAQGNIKDIGTNDGARFTYLNKGDKVYTAQETQRILSGFESTSNASRFHGKDVAGNSYDLMILNKSMKDVEQAIKNNQSSMNVSWQTFAKGIPEIVERSKKGGDITYNRYRVR